MEFSSFLIRLPGRKPAPVSINFLDHSLFLLYPENAFWVQLLQIIRWKKFDQPAEVFLEIFLSAPKKNLDYKA